MPIWAYGPVLLLLAVQLPLVLPWGSFEIRGERYFALAEDAMISMRYARNLAEGEGLVWNPGERVEGFTNPLWTLSMAAVHATGLEDRLTSLPVMVTNVASNALCAGVLAQLVATAGGGTAAMIAAGVVYGLSLYPALYALSGLEHTLQTLFVLLACRGILRDQRAGRSSALTFLWIGLPAIVRSDGLTFTVVLALAAVWRAGWHASVPRNLLVAGAPFAAWLAFRLAYYHDFLPNTYYLKMQIPLALRLGNGITYSARLLEQELPLLAAIAIGALVGRLRNRDVSMLLAICIGFFAVATWEGGTIIGPRLLMPAYALGVAAMVLCLGRNAAVTGAGALIVLWTTPHLDRAQVERFAVWQRAPGYTEMALAIRANTRPESKIAVTGAGAIPYFARRPTVDLLGVSDRHIARLPVSGGGTLVGHNKMDFDWSLGHLAPDLVVSQLRRDLSREQLEQLATGDRSYLGRMRLNRFFRELYEPNLVPLSAREPHWAHLYVRADSPELARIGEWKIP